MSGRSQCVVAIVACVSMGLLSGFPAGAKEKNEDTDDDQGYVSFTKDSPRGEVLPDKALLYVLRPSSLGFAIKSWFLCDDDVLGVNKGDSYFFAHVDPGKRLLWSKSENVDALELEVKAGETYYVQQQVKMGGMKARTRLEILDEAEGEKLLAKCDKHGTLTEAGRERGMEIAREYKDRTAKDLERRAKKEEKNQEK